MIFVKDEWRNNFLKYKDIMFVNTSCKSTWFLKPVIYLHGIDSKGRNITFAFGILENFS